MSGRILSRDVRIDLTWNAVLGACLLSLAACTFPHAEPYRYKLKIRVTCDGAEQVGESVIETTWIDQRSDGVGSSFGSESTGDAVAVKLCGDNGYLFALLSRVLPAGRPYENFHIAATPVAVLNGFASIDELVAAARTPDARWEFISNTRAKRQQVKLTPDQYPLFVRFRDLADPLSVEMVALENMSAKYDGRVAIGSVSLEIVDDPVTRTIKTILPWLDDLDASLSGNARRATGSLPDRLNREHFTR